MKRELTALISAAAVAVGISFSLSATTAYVVPEGTPSTPKPPYNTKATAAACINDAVAYALSAEGADIDEIVLASGTHHTREQMTIDRALTIRGEGGREQVTVDAEKKCCQLVLNHKDAKLTGLAIQGVNNTETNGGKNLLGGGVRILKGIVEDCILRNNQHSYAGGGGGAYLGSADAVLSRCIVTNNLRNSTTRGGGVYADGGLIANCYIANNTANHGSAALISSKSVRLVNCFIRGSISKSNQNDQHGLSGTFVNCAVVLGVDLDKKEANRVLVGPTDNYTAVNCAFVVTEAPEGGVPNAVDSLLTTEAAMELQGPLEIPGDDSSLIDKGTPDNDMGEIDLGGRPRLKGAKPDIGCWENQTAEFSVSFSSPEPKVRVGEAMAFEVNVKNPPAGATLEYGWTFTPEFGNPIAVTGTEPTLSIATLQPAYYTVSLTVTDTTGGTSAAPSVRENYAYVAPLELLVLPTGSTGEPKRPYTTWATAATNLEAALACALPGTSVILADGVHCTTGTVAIASAVTVKGLNGREKAIVVPCPCPSSAFVLNDTGATLRGLTITNTSTTANGAIGGAVRIEKGVVEDCRITAAKTNFGGRGIAVRVGSSESVLRRTIIDHCEDASTSYGIVHAIAGLVENCLISDSYAYCPGILLVGEGRFTTDAAKIEFGGVALSTALVRNCTVVSGQTKNTSYGLLSYYGGSVSNCVLISGNARIKPSTTNLTPDWTPLKGDVLPEANVGHCCVSTDSTAFGSDCVIAAKEKVFKDFAGGDFTLRQGSPCVNAAALDRGWMDGATDLIGAPRIINGLPDIGCYESKYGAGLILLMR